MTDDLPLRWIRRGPSDEFRGEACRGEFYVFQVGVFAAREAIRDLAVEISDLRCRGGAASAAAIPAANFHAFNFRGVDWLGRPIKRRVHVARGKVAALWFGVEIPPGTAPGAYAATLAFLPHGAEPSRVRLALTVSPQRSPTAASATCGGRRGSSGSTRPSGWTTKWSPPTRRCPPAARRPDVGPAVAFAETGLPRSIESNGQEILAAPVAMVAETRRAPSPGAAAGRPCPACRGGRAAANREASAGRWQMTCRAKMEFDGYINFRVRSGGRSAPPT